MRDSQRRRARPAGVRLLLALAVAMLGVAPPLYAQEPAARVLITAPIDETYTVRLAGNTRPEVNARNDRGRVADALPLPHLQLLLKRPPEREAALQRYLAQLHDRRSPNYHRWLSALAFGERFGLAPQDVAAVTGWLRQRGFTINVVYPSARVIDFSGTAGVVRAAFHTEIHALAVAGVAHIANMGDPRIPTALAPAVEGIVSLNDFRPHPLYRPRAAYTVSSSELLLAPADLATIYNINPLLAKGVTGQNQTIVVLEDSDVYNYPGDWDTFRSTFGLSGYTSGSFNQVHPAPATGTNNCSDPGVANGDDGEATLDAEWASAAAPGAAIELASCADTTTFGGLIALQNLLSNSGTMPAIVSLSYGECEAENTATANAAFSAAYEQAVAEGVSMFVAAGDSGAAGCDHDESTATHGVGVSGFASTPYNVAVGGTDFGDAVAGTTSTYWSSTNSASYGSALSYIPEIPWNDSCAGTLLSGYAGYPAYGSGSFCNNSASKKYRTTAAGSGGPSACASGSPATAGIVGGSCAGTPKPSWQSGVAGIPADGVRDLPDVALFAGNGVWGHYYVFCWSDTSETGGASCGGAPSSWSGAGGTSFASPILAGIQALVNQSTGKRQGNPNPVYYSLAASQAAAGLNCNSSNGNQVASGCVFYDVTKGDMDVDCEGSSDCYLPAGTYGVLSTSDSTDASAYAAGTGWDFATGLGSLNAANLVTYWGSSTVSLKVTGSVSGSGLATYTLTLGNQGPQTASSVSVSAQLPAGASLVASASSAGCTQSGSTLTCAAGSLGVGSTLTLTVVVQAATPGTIAVAFTASTANGDLDPSDGMVSMSLSWSDPDAGGDGPVPLWTYGLMGAALLATASRRARGHVQG